MRNIEQISFDEFVKTRFKREPESALKHRQNFALAHAVTGIAGEAGEVVDEVKKHLYTEKPLNVWKVVQELGDLEFYMSALRQELKITRQECLDACEYKLNLRHPDGNTRAHYTEDQQ